MDVLPSYLLSFELKHIVYDCHDVIKEKAICLVKHKTKVSIVIQGVINYDNSLFNCLIIIIKVSLVSASHTGLVYLSKLNLHFIE